VWNVQYVRLVERLSTTLGLAPFPADLTVDEATSAVVARCEQLAQHDAGHKSLVCGLRHKVKRHKEKLADKVTNNLVMSSGMLRCDISRRFIIIYYYY